MKKFWLSLGLTLMLVGVCGVGYYGLGTRPAFGQTYYLSCDPRDPDCYREYYVAPYADPDSQYRYYVAPPVGRDQRHERQETTREHRDRKRGDRIEREEHRD
jgi:hypothetical protein